MAFPFLSRITAAYLLVPVLLISLYPLTAVASSPSITLTNPPTQTTILPNTSMAFTVAASGFTAPTYTASDSFSNSSISNSNVAVAGDSAQVSWSPSSNDIGTHVITVTVSDQYASRSVHVTFLVVSSLSQGVVRFGPPSPSTTLTAGQTLTFWTIAAGFPETPYESLTDSFANSTISNGNLTETQQFTWTTTAHDVGTHTITLTAKDRNGNVADNSITVVVNPDPNAAATATSAAPTSTVQAPPAAPTTIFTAYLTPGSENAQVLALQKTLASLGFLTATPNGYFGANTKKAVIAFQKAHALTPLGVVGPGTRAALNAISKPSTASSTQAQGHADALAKELAQLQAKLAALTGR